MANSSCVLIVGRPNTGKSASIRDMKRSTAYINADGKELPFLYDEEAVNVQHLDDPIEALEMLSYLSTDDAKDDYEFVVLDTVTDLMRRYERMHVKGSANGLQAWAEYGDFYQDIMDNLKKSPLPSAVFAHVNPLNSKEGVNEARVPIKGANGERGIESDFSIILVAKRMKVALLKKWVAGTDLLNITPAEEAQGVKYVLQTMYTKDAAGETIRSLVDMWDISETYIDNDLNIVFDRLVEYRKRK